MALDANYSAHKDDNPIVGCHLIELGTSTTKRYNDTQYTVQYDTGDGSEEWTARAFIPGGIEYSMRGLASIEIEIDDVDGEVRDALIATSGDVTVDIWEVLCDGQGKLVGDRKLWTGYVGQAQYTVETTQLAIEPGPTPIDVVVPSWRLGRTCGVPVNGDVCGLTGATCDRRWSTCLAQVGAASFTGSGTDDLTASGSHDGDTRKLLWVEIDGTGSPDTFKWGVKDGVDGAYPPSSWTATTVAITGSTQELSSGGVVYCDIEFGDVTGHTSGDYWEIRIGNTDRFGGCPMIPEDKIYTVSSGQIHIRRLQSHEVE
jgi:hypothetical protein